ncbi:MAG: FHA domain-containing protein, partial [Thermoanaerobaculia bacterium]
MTFRFGEYTFDPSLQELRRGDERLALTPKVISLLELLIECRGTLVTHADIQDRLWPDVVVAEANVKNLVSTLRGVLDDHERDGRFIRNVHHRGYVFTDAVIEVSHGAHVSAHLVRGDEIIRLAPGRNVIGRRQESAVAFEDASVSRIHAAITIHGADITLEDLESKNGTFVDGVRIDKPLALDDRHVLIFGDVATHFSRTHDDATTDSVHLGVSDTARPRAVAAALGRAR